MDFGASIVVVETDITGETSFFYSFDGPAVLDDRGWNGFTYVGANIYFYVQRRSSSTEYCLHVINVLYKQGEDEFTQEKEN